MRIFNFVVLFVIPHYVPTPQLAKPICLLFHLTYVTSNWIEDQKASRGAKLPRKTLQFIKGSSLSS